MKIIKIQKNKGFTLIELMVSISIFSMIMLTAMGSFLVTLNTSRQSRALSLAMDNVNFAMESMTRSIRMGRNYACVNSWTTNPSPGNCNETNFITFTPQNKPDTYRIGYQLAGNGVLNRYDNSSTPIPIVSPNVKIDELFFTVKGALPDDQIQASIYIIMKGSIMVKGVPQSFSLQTLASQRNF